MKMLRNTQLLSKERKVLRAEPFADYFCICALILIYHEPLPYKKSSVFIRLHGYYVLMR